MNEVLYPALLLPFPTLKVVNNAETHSGMPVVLLQIAFAEDVCGNKRTTAIKVFCHRNAEVLAS